MPKSAKLGQNFLHDKHIAAKIVDAFLPQPAGGNLRGPTSRSLGTGGPSRPAWTGPVLEIGSGPGILSGLLLEKIPAADVTLVEIDRFLAQRLRERFGDPPRIIQEDILKIDLAAIYPRDRVAVIGNLPYHISKELVDWLIAQRGRISAAVLMLQKDFVDKVLAAPGGKKYNAQSVLFQLLFQARRCFHVPAGAFTPAPRIMSTVIAVQPADFAVTAAADEFYPFVKLCFAERRKTLWNNLAPHQDKNLLAAAFAACGLAATVRAEQLAPERFAALFAAMNKDA
jgi:16S rRNA (adenine1518-N6/adenine1519-N6)-dimethyltransferase